LSIEHNLRETEFLWIVIPIKIKLKGNILILTTNKVIGNRMKNNFHAERNSHGTLIE